MEEKKIKAQRNMGRNAERALYVLNRYLNIFKRIKEYLVTLISI
jgi:hypothetical protein